MCYTQNPYRLMPSVPRTPLAPSSPRRSSLARSAREISLVDPARARRAMSYVSYARTHRIGHVPRRSRARRSRRSKNRPRSPARARPAPAQCTTCTEDNPYIATSRRLTSDSVALPSVGLFHKALLAKCSVLSPVRHIYTHARLIRLYIMTTAALPRLRPISMSYTRARRRPRTSATACSAPSVNVHPTKLARHPSPLSGLSPHAASLCASS